MISTFCYSEETIPEIMSMQAQIDGKVVRAKFTLTERKKPTSPPRAIASGSKRDATKNDGAGPDMEKDGPKRQREGRL